MKIRTKYRKLKFILFLAFFAVAVVFGVLMLQKYRSSQRQPVGPVQPQPAGTVQISLFFAAPDGQGLERETREIDACGNDLVECVQDSVEELVNGPMGELGRTLPDTTIVNSVKVNGDTAVVDFSKELADGLPGGSSSEMTAVYSVVDTISFNFHQIKKVKFLLEGQDVETLKGHLDLRAPLEPDFQLEKNSEKQAAPGQH
jgi:spore germination protein GerM